MSTQRGKAGKVVVVVVRHPRGITTRREFGAVKRRNYVTLLCIRLPLFSSAFFPTLGKAKDSVADDDLIATRSSALARVLI